MRSSFWGDVSLIEFVFLCKISKNKLKIEVGLIIGDICAYVSPHNSNCVDSSFFSVQDWRPRSLSLGTPANPAAGRLLNVGEGEHGAAVRY